MCVCVCTTDLMVSPQAMSTPGIWGSVISWLASKQQEPSHLNLLTLVLWVATPPSFSHRCQRLSFYRQGYYSTPQAPYLCFRQNILSFIICDCVFVHVNICMYMCWCPKSPRKKGTGCLGAAVSGTSELPDMGARIWTLVLMIQQSALQTTEPAPLTKHIWTLSCWIPKVALFLYC